MFSTSAGQLRRTTAAPAGGSASTRPPTAIGPTTRNPATASASGSAAPGGRSVASTPIAAGSAVKLAGFMLPTLSRSAATAPSDSKPAAPSSRGAGTSASSHHGNGTGLAHAAPPRIGTAGSGADGSGAQAGSGSRPGSAGEGSMHSARMASVYRSSGAGALTQSGGPGTVARPAPRGTESRGIGISSLAASMQALGLGPAVAPSSSSSSSAKTSGAAQTAAETSAQHTKPVAVGTPSGFTTVATYVLPSKPVAGASSSSSSAVRASAAAGSGAGAGVVKSSSASGAATMLASSSGSSTSATSTSTSVSSGSSSSSRPTASSASTSSVASVGSHGAGRPAPAPAPSTTASASSSSSTAHRLVHKEKFKFAIRELALHATVGTGTFGRVRVVQHKPSSKFFALKILKKSEIIRLKQVDHIKSEVKLLTQIHHPFIVNLFGHMQDDRRLYMLFEYVPGGELFSHLRRENRFSNDHARFYAAQITMAFEYLHAFKIVYRDLKPENLLLSAKGNIKITDFGFAKVVDDRTWTLCGTPEYLAPEIIQSKGHDKGVDWWALGILIFEMLAGFPPFFDENPYGIYQKILAGRIDFPKHFSEPARDLIRKLLTADKTKRIGCLRNGAVDIKEHPWFKGLNWEELYACKLSAPFVPKVRDDKDTSNFDDYPESDGESDSAGKLSQKDAEYFLEFDSF